MSNDQEVAVITRTKDRLLFLPRCIESVLSQEFQNWVHVIVNDGGDAADVIAITKRYGDRYGSRLILLHHERCMGMEAASNTGLRGSRSKLVAFLDDDDTWDRQFLAKMVSTFERVGDDQVNGIACQTEIVRERIDAGEIVELAREPFNPRLKAVALEQLLAVNRFTNNAFLFRRPAQEEIGYFNERLPALGDWDFNLRFVLRFEVVVLQEMLARWHLREDGTATATANSLYTAGNLHTVWYARMMNDAIRGQWLGENPHVPSIMALGGRLFVIEQLIENLRSNWLAQNERAIEQNERNVEDLKRTIRDYSFIWQMQRAVRTVLKRIFGRS